MMVRSKLYSSKKTYQKQNVVKVGPPLTKLSGSAHASQSSESRGSKSSLQLQSCIDSTFISDLFLADSPYKRLIKL